MPSFKLMDAPGAPVQVIFRLKRDPGTTVIRVWVHVQCGSVGCCLGPSGSKLLLWGGRLWPVFGPTKDPILGKGWDFNFVNFLYYLMCYCRDSEYVPTLLSVEDWKSHSQGSQTICGRGSHRTIWHTHISSALHTIRKGHGRSDLPGCTASSAHFYARRGLCKTNHKFKKVWEEVHTQITRKELMEVANHGKPFEARLEVVVMGNNLSFLSAFDRAKIAQAVVDDQLLVKVRRIVYRKRNGNNYLFLAYKCRKANLEATYEGQWQSSTLHYWQPSVVASVDLARSGQYSCVKCFSATFHLACLKISHTRCCKNTSLYLSAC